MSVYKLVSKNETSINFITGVETTETFYEIRGPGIWGVLFRSREEAQEVMEALEATHDMPLPTGYAEF